MDATRWLWHLGWALCGLVGLIRPGLAAVPSVVLIIADDLGCEDLTAYGNRGLATPHLDRLAREGMTFTRAFVTASSCSPSRASLITGRYPHATGAERLHSPVPAGQVTFVERLREAGYHTVQAGKWHLGPHLRERFDRVADRRGGEEGPVTQWLDVLRERPRDRPLFAWLAAVDPHRPYSERAIPQPHDPDTVQVPPYLPDTPVTRRDLALYYDEVARLDAHVGRVLAELEQQGILDQTLVLFLSDNGRPFPRCKTTLYDSGVRTPLLARWPGQIPAGTTCSGLVSTVDIASTLLELARAQPLTTAQGVSFARLLRDPSARVREVVHLEHNWHDYAAHERGVRTERFKYIHNAWPDLPGTPPADAVTSPTFAELRRLRDAGELTPPQRGVFVTPRAPEELYDTEADPHELQNLATDPRYAGELLRLRQQLADWRAATGDTVPAERPADGFDRETGAKRGAQQP